MERQVWLTGPWKYCYATDGGVSPQLRNTKKIMARPAANIFLKKIKRSYIVKQIKIVLISRLFFGIETLLKVEIVTNCFLLDHIILIGITPLTIGNQSIWELLCRWRFSLKQ